MRFVLSLLQGSVPEYALCTRHNSPLSTLYTIHYTLYIISYILYTLHRTLYTSHYTLNYILYCTILYYAMLCYTILCYAMLYYTVLYYTIPYYTRLDYTRLYYSEILADHITISYIRLWHIVSYSGMLRQTISCNVLCDITSYIRFIVFLLQKTSRACAWRARLPSRGQRRRPDVSTPRTGGSKSLA